MLSSPNSIIRSRAYQLSIDRSGDQLLLEDEESKVNQAAYSQPLCCAVQVILTKLLQASGATFRVILDHSWVEIACAFAAGFISASQAIRIAYLPGLTAEYARGVNGVEGAMMAAGTSFDDATELCALEAFAGRVVVAASNAPESVTLSGYRDAILEMQEVLNEEWRFNRILNIEKAYHSHHMRLCSDPDITALKACGRDVPEMEATPSVTWISSVFEGHVMTPENLKAEYWGDSLVSSVLFSYAVEQVLMKRSPFDVCIEVGPHPTLKGSSLQTIKNCAATTLPYTGCMDRNKTDTEAFSACLGYLWSQFGSPAMTSTVSWVSCHQIKALQNYPRNRHAIRGTTRGCTGRSLVCSVNGWAATDLIFCLASNCPKAARVPFNGRISFGGGTSNG
jgi:acyl transferase domain-containing protein